MSQATFQKKSTTTRKVSQRFSFGWRTPSNEVEGGVFPAKLHIDTLV
jgi:hypothetical protein